MSLLFDETDKMSSSSRICSRRSFLQFGLESSTNRIHTSMLSSADINAPASQEEPTLSMSSCRAGNSSSPSNVLSSSSISWGYNLVFLKHLTIVSGNTSFQACFPHSSAIERLMDFTISLAFFTLSTLEQTYRISLFLYLTFQFAMMPASSGCVFAVVFFGRKLMVMLDNLCADQLKNSTTLPPPPPPRPGI